MLPTETNAKVRGARPVPIWDTPSRTFCPRCVADGSPDDRLCPACGEALVDRGYCPTCEALWKLPVGSPCPKHEVLLETEPPPPEPLGATGPHLDRWVTVATYSHPNLATAPRIRLEAEGVPTFLDGARVADSTLYQVATGGVRLQVPESLAATARVLLAQNWTAPGLAADGKSDATECDDDDDPWAGLAPDPGAWRRRVMKQAIILSLVGSGLMTATNLLATLFGWRL